MKNYLVFYGSITYPLGGFFDFKKSFDTEEEAFEFLEINKNDWSWYHIYDLELWSILYDYEK